MIPHRMLSNEFFGTGVKERVTACRKRLRVNRHQQRLQINVSQSFDSEVNTLFPAEYIELPGGVGEGSEELEGWIKPELEIGIT